LNLLFPVGGAGVMAGAMNARAGGGTFETLPAVIAAVSTKVKIRRCRLTTG
jgi:hypothetical protein